MKARQAGMGPIRFEDEYNNGGFNTGTPSDLPVGTNLSNYIGKLICNRPNLEIGCKNED